MFKIYGYNHYEDHKWFLISFALSNLTNKLILNELDLCFN